MADLNLTALREEIDKLERELTAVVNLRGTPEPVRIALRERRTPEKAEGAGNGRGLGHFAWAVPVRIEGSPHARRPSAGATIQRDASGRAGCGG